MQRGKRCVRYREGKKLVNEIGLKFSTFSRTNVHLLVFHLTIADSIVSFITMPLEAGWRFTMQWKADNISCKLLMVVRALGYYLSSAILVMLCVDRYSSPQLTCFQYVLLKVPCYKTSYDDFENESDT